MEKNNTLSCFPIDVMYKEEKLQCKVKTLRQSQTGERKQHLKLYCKKFESRETTASFTFHLVLVMWHKSSGSRGRAPAKTSATALHRIKIRVLCNHTSGDRQFGSAK